MTEDDVLFGFRLRLFTWPRSLATPRSLPGDGVARSTYYAWKPKLERYASTGCG